jgi:hypothetical protein
MGTREVEWETYILEENLRVGARSEGGGRGGHDGLERTMRSKYHRMGEGRTAAAGGAATTTGAEVDPGQGAVTVTVAEVHAVSLDPISIRVRDSRATAAAEAAAATTGATVVAADVTTAPAGEILPTAAAKLVFNPNSALNLSASAPLFLPAPTVARIDSQRSWAAVVVPQVLTWETSEGSVDGTGRASRMWSTHKSVTDELGDDTNVLRPVHRQHGTRRTTFETHLGRSMGVADFINGLECELDPVVESHSTLDLRGGALAERDGGRGDEGSLALGELAMRGVPSGGEDDEGGESEGSSECDHGDDLW